MNPRLVICLFGASLVGLMSAAVAVFLGWHPLAAVPVFSISGSFATVAFCLVLVPRPAAPAVGQETATA